jgi:hypothetical protein
VEERNAVHGETNHNALGRAVVEDGGGVVLVRLEGMGRAKEKSAFTEERMGRLLRDLDGGVGDGEMTLTTLVGADEGQVGCGKGDNDASLVVFHVALEVADNDGHEEVLLLLHRSRRAQYKPD